MRDPLNLGRQACAETACSKDYRRCCGCTLCVTELREMLVAMNHDPFAVVAGTQELKEVCAALHDVSSTKAVLFDGLRVMVAQQEVETP